MPTEAQKQLKISIDSFPETFGLRAFPGDLFRISRESSYMNDSGVFMLYTEIYSAERGWQSFAKGTATELRGEIVAAPEPKRREPEPLPGSVEFTAANSTIKSFYVSMVYDLLGVFVEYRADTQRAVELYLEKHYLRDGTWKLPWCAIYHMPPAATSSTLPLHIVKAQCGNIYEADFTR